MATNSWLRSEPARTIEIDIDVWTRIVFAAKESDDWKLRTLIEQAVMGPVAANQRRSGDR